MIPNQWYAVLESSEVPVDKPVGAVRFGKNLVFWRDAGGQVACFLEKCPHRGARLSGGKITDGHLACPFHGFQFDPTGRCVFIPANGRGAEVPKVFRTDRVPTVEAHGYIFAWYGDPQEDLPSPRFFTDLDEDFSYAWVKDPWRAHYSRVIENQLDVVHLPFVHYNTIGRGHRTLVDGPLVEWQDENSFRVYVFNRTDDGSSPKKARDLSSQGQIFHLEFLFPNLWENYISPNVRIVAAFVPVDDEHTLLYLRFYQRFLRVPGLRELVNQLSIPVNLYIAHQDRTVVETQRPFRTDQRMGEKLVQGDRPIIEYRQRRELLILKTTK